jgi:hypothetical protein
MLVNTYPKKVVEVKHILLEQYKYRKEINISSYMFKVFNLKTEGEITLSCRSTQHEQPQGSSL